MAEPLRLLLMLLVLTNVAFVHLTGALQPLHTVVLSALTLSAPWLCRLQGKVGYQLLWNGSVVVIFAVLLRHALSTGLLHMLEDGLLLAALCQVHLLNNLSRKQRPDLLFFNSFLIAFITSFFSQDLGWSATFIGYVAVLVPALQFYVALPAHRQPPPGLARAVLRSSAGHAGAALVLTALAFAFWPRDFHRQGWLQDHLDLSQLAGMQTGFNEEIRLDRSGSTSTSERVVLRIVPQQGDPQAVPTHWRGATLVDFDGTAWSADPGDHFIADLRTDPTWTRTNERCWRRAPPTTGAALQVRVDDIEADRVFLPQAAVEFEFSARLAPAVQPRTDGTVYWAREAVPRRRGLAPGYQVRLGDGPRRPPAVGDLARRRLLQLGPLELPPPLLALAQELRGRLPSHPAPAVIAETMRSWLSMNRRYALPGSPDAARSFDEFLLGHAGGHCELFAATLAMLLRMQGLPCRIATGYLAHEWDGQRGEVVVRRRDAHAWVEVLVEGQGWITCDATPPAGMEPAELVAAEGLWARGERWLRGLWATVTGFDGDRRAAVVAWLLALPGAVYGFAAAHPLSCLMALLWLAAAMRWGWRRRRRVDPSVQALLLATRRAGVRWLPGETPRELLARARRQPMVPVRLQALVVAATEHERRRYGNTEGPRP